MLDKTRTNYPCPRDLRGLVNIGFVVTEDWLKRTLGKAVGHIDIRETPGYRFDREVRRRHPPKPVIARFNKGFGVIYICKMMPEVGAKALRGIET